MLLMNRLNVKAVARWELANIIMVPACSFISVKMVVLNGFNVILFTGAAAKWAFGHSEMFL